MTNSELKIPSEAITDLQWFVKKLSGIVELVPFLEELPKIEQATRERQAVLDQLSMEVSKLEDRQKKAKANLLEAQEEFDRILTDARVDAKAILESAASEAAKIVREARDPLQQEIADLEKEIDRLKEDASNERGKLLTARTETKNETIKLEHARSELARLRNSI